jgi:putative transposase
VRTVRTEVTDRLLIVVSGAVLDRYVSHHSGRRPHRGRHLVPPRPDFPVADLSQKRVVSRSILGGLINEHEPAEA